MNILRFTAAFATFAALFTLAVDARADAFEDANRAFAQGRFAESARGWEDIIKRDGYSPAVLFNLGNAQLRDGKSGEAILSYERAHWLAPGDADIAANLRFARQRAGLGAAQEPWGASTVSAFGPNAWAWLGSAALTALCAGIIGIQFSRRRAAFQVLTVAGALGLLGAAAAIVVYARQLDRAVIPASGTAALLSPFAGAGKVCDFPAGQSVRVERSHGDFSFVRDHDGHAGWVKTSEVGRIVPERPAA